MINTIFESTINRHKIKMLSDSEDNNRLTIYIYSNIEYEWFDCCLDPILNLENIDNFIVWIKSISQDSTRFYTLDMESRYRFKNSSKKVFKIEYNSREGIEEGVSWSTCHLSPYLFSKEYLAEFISFLERCRSHLRALELL